MSHQRHSCGHTATMTIVQWQMPGLYVNLYIWPVVWWCHQLRCRAAARGAGVVDFLGR